MFVWFLVAFFLFVFVFVLFLFFFLHRVLLTVNVLKYFGKVVSQKLYRR